MLRIVVLVAGLLAAANAFAHGLSGPDAAEVGAGILGPNAACSATAEVTTSTPREPRPRTSEWRYFYRNGQTRIEPVLSKDAGVTPEVLHQMTTQGTDVRIILLRPEGRYVVYPKVRAYHPYPTPTADLEELLHGPKGAKPVERGHETVHGHPCRKYELPAVNSDEDVTFTKWEAEDMDGFPIQVEVHHADDVMTFSFREVNRTPPEASLFDVPADYKRYETYKDFESSLQQPAH